MAFRLFNVNASYALVAVVVCLLSACSQSEFLTTPVHGIVLCGGKPLPGGFIYFSPIGEAGKTVTGKTASGVVDSDGKFILSTYIEGDGAIVGKHRVSYVTPAETDAEARKFPCASAPPVELEVKSGQGKDLQVNLGT